MLPETLRAKKTIKSTMGQPTAAGTASASPVDPITPERDDGAVVDVATTGPGLKLQWVRRRASLEGCKLTLDSLDALDLEGARCTPRGDGGLRLRLRGGRRVLIRSPRKEDAKLLDAVAGACAPPTVEGCVGINQCVGCTRKFFTKSYLGDDAAVLAPSSGEEPASPRHRAGVASMAGRTT